MIRDLWYKNAIIYSLALDSFLDSDGDGIGRARIRREPLAATSRARQDEFPVRNIRLWPAF